MFKRILACGFFLAVFIVFFSQKKTSAQSQTTNLGPWQQSAVFPNDTTHPMPSFVAGNYYYVLLRNTQIIYARINQDGTLGQWQIASTNHGEGSGRGYAAVVINGIPYMLRFGRVEKFNIDQNSGNVISLDQVGASNGIGDNYYYWNSAVVADFGTNQYVFNLGGFDCCGAPHYSTNNRIFRSSNALANPWQWVEMNITKPYRNPYKGFFYKDPGGTYGYIYTSDLEQTVNPDPLYRIKVKSDGSFEGNWINTGNLPTKDAADDNSLGDSFVVSSNNLFITRGKKVYRTLINSNDGSLTGWTDINSNLPVRQIDKPWGPSVDGDHSDGQSYGIKGNFVYLTGPDRVYFAQILGSGQPTPTNTPVPSSTGTPPTNTPTRVPSPTNGPIPTTPCSGINNASITFAFQPDRVRFVGNFNNSGGLTILAVNNTGQCSFTRNNISIVYNSTNSGGDYWTEQPIQLPSGNYSFYLSGPRNLRQQFNGIALSPNQALDCRTQNNTGCGDLGDINIRITKMLATGDANRDNVINSIDYELYRIRVGQTGTGNNSDFDYNNSVEFIQGNNDDFLHFKNNFGKQGV